MWDVPTNARTWCFGHIPCSTKTGRLKKPEAVFPFSSCSEERCYCLCGVFGTLLRFSQIKPLAWFVVDWRIVRVSRFLFWRFFRFLTFSRRHRYARFLFARVLWGRSGPHIRMFLLPTVRRVMFRKPCCTTTTHAHELWSFCAIVPLHDTSTTTTTTSGKPPHALTEASACFLLL